MDKSTLSNYGWIVIAALVLSVMIALATPFGSYIENGVRATTEGLFDTSKEAMNTAFNAMGVEVKDQDFTKEENQIYKLEIICETLLDFEIPFDKIYIEYKEGMTWQEWMDSEYCKVLDSDGNEIEMYIFMAADRYVAFIYNDGGNSYPYNNEKGADASDIIDGSKEHSIVFTPNGWA
jgi:hypothetical protein